MIDLSDGLSRDIGHICRQSGVGALIDASLIPVHEDAIEMRRDGHSPLEHALHDGEDYELLFTAPANFSMLVKAIGIITAETTIVLDHGGNRREQLEPKGWEHSL
jgi:thiamine-monophosphate kinase